MPFILFSISLTLVMLCLIRGITVVASYGGCTDPKDQFIVMELMDVSLLSRLKFVSLPRVLSMTSFANRVSHGITGDAFISLARLH